MAKRKRGLFKGASDLYQYLLTRRFLPTEGAFFQRARRTKEVDGGHDGLFPPGVRQTDKDDDT